MDTEEVGRPRGQEAPEAAHRAHLREMTAARQVAERARRVRSGGLALRRARDAAYDAAMARIAEEHAAWLRRWAAPDGPGA